MDNGCPKCEKLGEYDLCLDCQLEQAEATVLQDMNQVERLKKKIKEKENDNRSIK